MREAAAEVADQHAKFFRVAERKGADEIGLCHGDSLDLFGVIGLCLGHALWSLRSSLFFYGFEFDNHDMIACERIHYDRATVLRQLGIFHDPEYGFAMVPASDYALGLPGPVARSRARNRAYSRADRSIPVIVRPAASPHHTPVAPVSSTKPNQ